MDRAAVDIKDYVVAFAFKLVDHINSLKRKKRNVTAFHKIKQCHISDTAFYPAYAGTDSKNITS